MAGVSVFFVASERGVVQDVMSTLRLGYGTSIQGYHFDSVTYTADNALAVLTRGSRTLHVPMRHILLVAEDPGKDDEK